MFLTLHLTNKPFLKPLSQEFQLTPELRSQFETSLAKHEHFIKHQPSEIPHSYKLNIQSKKIGLVRIKPLLSHCLYSQCSYFNKTD